MHPRGIPDHSRRVQVRKLCILQLGDLHLRSTTSDLKRKWQAVISVATAELDHQTTDCVIALCGDIVNSGKTTEFEDASLLIGSLVSAIQSTHVSTKLHILSVPGNHDCHIDTLDVPDRESAREGLVDQVPGDSKARTLLKAQDEYFRFAAKVSSENKSLSSSCPYYDYYDIYVGDDVVRFHLLNSSWSSMRHEQQDLRFPLSQFKPPQAPYPRLGIAMIHHPACWFLMPGVRKEFEEEIRKYCDMVLTGHEHYQSMARLTTSEGHGVNYVEGGVLQEHGSEESTFNVVRIELPTATQSVRRYRWRDDHYECKDNFGEHMTLGNGNREDKPPLLKRDFKEWLNDMEDPLTHPRVSPLRLADVYAYPDLRKTHASAGKHSKSPRFNSRIQSAEVADEVLSKGKVLIVGDDRSGKTSLSKQLFMDAMTRALVPLVVKGSDISRSGHADGVRKMIHRAVGLHYQHISLEAYEQLDKAKRILIIDDIHNGPTHPDSRAAFLTECEQRFSLVIILASVEFDIELLNRAGQDAAILVGYDRYEICEFGQERLEDLATKWVSLGTMDTDPSDSKAKVLETCEQIQTALSLVGLPHTPWLLLVILEQSDQPDPHMMAAKNGNYGHLYQSVITVALNKSRMKQFDLSGKFTYLSELAHYLYTTGASYIIDSQMREFHKSHNDKFGLPFDYLSIRDDFIQTRMLRIDDNDVSFRSKWVYCFFLAWWTSRQLQLQRPAGTELVNILATRIHNETAANTLVFLAFLSNSPAVVGSMRTAASSLYAKSPLAKIEADVKDINKLNSGGSLFKLPKSDPEVNRKLLMRARDSQVIQNGTESRDGRRLLPISQHNSIEDAEIESVKEIRSALKMIQILGQVLRNGATSIEENEKRIMLSEVVALGRRVLGYIYKSGAELDAIAEEIKERLLKVLVEVKGQDHSPNEQGVKLDIAALKKQADEAAAGFWFNLYWSATFGLIKRISSAIAHPVIDGTLDKMVREDQSLPNTLIQLSVELGRRHKRIPADKMIAVHKELSADSNMLGKVVLEAMCWERLLLFETDHTQVDRLCSQMGIDVPKRSLDRRQKKFAKTKQIPQLEDKQGGRKSS